MKKIYIAGPMSGHKDYNYPAFFAAESKLIMDYEVINPARIGAEIIRGAPTHKTITPFGYQFIREDVSTSDIMRADLTELLKCDCIYMINGWADSKGACLELEIAQMLDMEIIFESEGVNNERD